MMDAGWWVVEVDGAWWIVAGGWWMAGGGWWMIDEADGQLMVDGA